MFVKKDGSTYYFDRRRCQVSQLKFGRIARKIKWTRHYVKGGGTTAVDAADKAAVEVEKAKAEGGEEAGKKLEAAKKS